MKRLLLFSISVFLLISPGRGQSTLSLPECRQLARENYPLVRQSGLINQSLHYTLENLSKGFYPQVSIIGQATLQSDVTGLPISLPGMKIPSINKDQYRVYADIQQTVYDGGMVRSQKAAGTADAEVETAKTETELYKITDRIDQLFFGILLLQEQKKQTDISLHDLNTLLDKTNAMVNQGVALSSSLDALKAEIIRLRQKQIEIDAGRKAFLDMLGLFIQKTLSDSVVLLKPEHPVLSTTINRPELQLFEAQSNAILSRNEILMARNRPKVSLFLQAGYGRPALNMLDNDFKSYYLGGLRLQAPLSGLYTLKNEKASLKLNASMTSLQKEAFILQTNIQSAQYRGEIRKYQDLLTTDDELIRLRHSLRTTAASQLENGVITLSDYIHEQDAEDQAIQNRSLHEMQLLLSEYMLRNTTGATN